MIKILLLTAMLLVGTGCSKKSVVAIEKDAKIVAVGDSLTFGYGGGGVNYPQELSKIIERKVENEGVSGDTSAQVLTRLERIIQDDQPTHVLLSIGGNDMLRHVGDNEIKSNIYQIIDKLEEQKIQVILVAQPRPKSTGLIFGLSDADFYKEVAEKKNLILINNAFSSLLSKQEYKSDMIHLNAIGYKKVAEAIAKDFSDKKLIKK